MDKQITVALNLAAVLAVEVNGVGVEGECAEAEKQSRWRDQAEAVGWLICGRCEREKGGGGVVG